MNEKPSLTEKLSYELLETVPRLMKLIFIEAQDVGAEKMLTQTQFRTLGHLFRGCRLPSELARELDLTPATISEVVDILVRRGLVKRIDEPGDRRKTPLEVTEEGINLYRLAVKRALLSIEKLVQQLSLEDQEKLYTSLFTLSEILKQKFNKDLSNNNEN